MKYGIYCFMAAIGLLFCLTTVRIVSLGDQPVGSKHLEPTKERPTKAVNTSVQASVIAAPPQGQPRLAGTANSSFAALMPIVVTKAEQAPLVLPQKTQQQARSSSANKPSKSKQQALAASPVSNGQAGNAPETMPYKPLTEQEWLTDYALEKGNAPMSLPAGRSGSLRLQIAVTNPWVDYAPDSVPIKIFISSDAVLGNSDNELSSAYLAKNERGTYEIPFIIPANMPEGNYYLIAKADVGSKVREIYEFNNSSEFSFIVTPREGAKAKEKAKR